MRLILRLIFCSIIFRVRQKNRLQNLNLQLISFFIIFPIPQKILKKKFATEFVTNFLVANVRSKNQSQI